MQAYDAVFSAPAHMPWGNDVQTVGPSLFGLYKAANGQHTYDRYLWDPSAGKPWWGDAPKDSGTLIDLFNADPFTAEGGTSLDGSQPLDAALCLDNPEAIYLFQGGLVRKMSVKGATFKVRDTDTYAQPIAQVFGSSENNPPFAFDRIRSALYSPKGGNSAKIWFFDHNSTNCVSVDADTYDQSGNNPAAINTEWKLDGLPTGLTTALTTAGTPFWATTQILKTNSDQNGQSQDKGYLSAGSDWCPFTLSTETPAMSLFTDPGDQNLTVPTGVTTLTLELWGPGGGGGGGDNNSGGNGGAGAYLRDTISVSPGQSLAFHVGASGDHTRYPATGDVILAAAGGGHGGGAGLDTNGGDGGAGPGYKGADNPHLQGGAPGGNGDDSFPSPPSGGRGGDNTRGGNGGDFSATGDGGAGGNGWNAAGQSTTDGAGGGGAGPGGADGGVCSGWGGSGGGSLGGKAGDLGGAGGGPAGGKGFAGNGAGAGGGGAGGNGWGGNGAGGGGGGAISGGGGSQGWSYLRDTNSTYYNGGSGTTPAGNPPAGTAAGGTGGSAGNADGNGGGNGGIRITW